MMVVCRNCGAKAPAESRYCPGCAARIAPYSEEEATVYIESLKSDSAEPEQATGGVACDSEDHAKSIEATQDRTSVSRFTGTSKVDIGIGIVFALVFIIMLVAGAGSDSVGLAIGLAALYLPPSVVANMRRKRNALAVFILNLLLGWTVVAWVVALVWGVTVDRD